MNMETKKAIKEGLIRIGKLELKCHVLDDGERVIEEQSFIDFWNDMGSDNYTGYVDYLNRGDFAGHNGDAGCFFNPNKSFRSLLISLDLYWENPVKEPNHLDYKFEKYEGELYFKSDSHKQKYSYDYDLWHAAESKRIKGKLVILKKLEIGCPFDEPNAFNPKCLNFTPSNNLTCTNCGKTSDRHL